MREVGRGDDGMCFFVGGRLVTVHLTHQGWVSQPPTVDQFPQGADLATAKEQLGFKYVHIRRTATGVLDHFIDTYETRFNQTGIGVRDWILTEYNAAVLTASFAAKQKSLRFW